MGKSLESELEGRVRHRLRGLCLPIDQPIQPNDKIINPVSLRAVGIAIELDVRLLESSPELGKGAGLKKREKDSVIDPINVFCRC